MATLDDLGLIHERVADVFGLPAWERDLDGLSELVLTILSQHTAYPNSRRAFERLRERFPTWEAVRAAEIEALELEFLAGVGLDEALAWLRRLPGVGPATAACALLFGLGRPAFPVDTGIHRVVRRLGLVPQRASAEQAQAVLQAAVPSAWGYPLHVNLIRHARQLCTPRQPRCEVCPLNDVCDHFQAHQRG